MSNQFAKASVASKSKGGISNANKSKLGPIEKTSSLEGTIDDVVDGKCKDAADCQGRKSAKEMRMTPLSHKS